jgi:hypothetical protein
MVLLPIAIIALLVYVLIQALSRIPLPDKSLMPVALGYRLTHWMMTPKPKKVEQRVPARINGRVASACGEVVYQKSAELVEAEQEVEALLSNTGVQQ